MINVVITGSGHFLPEKIVKNEEFLGNEFYDEQGNRIEKPAETIIQKFKEITEIEERRYVDDSLFNSDIAADASKKAIDMAGIDKEELDYVIAAHNFGDITPTSKRIDIMPSISAKIKNKVGIKNNHCRPYDMTFGCPGWIEGLILGTQLIKAGDAKKILVVGSDTLSRAVDPYDRTAMIFGDGAGAVILEAVESDVPVGVIAYDTLSDNGEEMNYLVNGPSLKENAYESDVNITMRGRKIYEYALRKVPALAKRVVEKAGLDISDIKKVLLHQANAKMDHAMVERLFKLYGIFEVPEGIAPMTVQKFGNSSVATVPTMFDLISRKQLEGHEFHSGDYILMGSVGAGMNINSAVYKMP